jgi:ABC-2 type transport system permease protein
MRKLRLVIAREYKMRVRTRTFVLSTVGLPLLMVAMLLIPTYLASRHSGGKVSITVVDEVGGLGSIASSALAHSRTPDGDHRFTVVSTIEHPANPNRTVDELTQQVLAGKLGGYLEFPVNVLDGGSARFYTRNPGNLTLTHALENAATQAVIGGRLARHNVKIADLKGLLKRVAVDVVKVSPRGEAKEKGQTLYVAIMLGIILYTSLLFYGINTMRSILEEKSSRIIEILLSSVRPFPLLAGKIIGVGAVGFTQYLIWAAAGAIVVTYGALMLSAFTNGSMAFHLHFPLWLWGWFIVFFLGGYFLYASLYAAIGAAATSDQDANQLQVPITSLVVASFFLFTVIMRNPDSTLSVTLSMIPFFSPILMILRLTLESPPLWQVLLSLSILVGSAIGVIYVSARIYRVGVLMYGKRPSLIELARWIRYS